MKEHILHIIDSLANGGAETLLKNTVNLLNDYEHTIIYLNDPDELKSQFINRNLRFINLRHKGWSSIFKTIREIKRIIKNEEPSIVHSHLLVSTICARRATPKTIPLVSTLHSIYSIDAFQKNIKSLWAERLTVKNRHALIAVSNYVLNDYLKYVPFKGKQFVLYNFIPRDFYNLKENKRTGGPLKCVAVGNLKEAKNYQYLLEILKGVKNENIQLDIYGSGPLKEELEKIISEHKLKVNVCGKSNNIKDTLSNYDLFIQASEHEGFGLSVIEAMAGRLPVFISDIPVFREITSGFGHFFPLDDVKKSAMMLLRLYHDDYEKGKYIEDAYKHCLENFSEDKYLHQLKSVYTLIQVP